MYLNARRLYDAGTLSGLASAIWEQGTEGQSPRKAAKVFVDKIKANGYDGIVLRDEEMGGTSFVVFESNQIKDVTNKTPTSKRDIRHSQRDPEAAEVKRALEKENTRLKEDVAELKEMLKLQRTVTGGTKFTKSSVDAAASVLMESADAKGNRAELTQMLNGLYEYIAQGEELTWEGVAEKAAPAVEWLQKNSAKQTDSDNSIISPLIKQGQSIHQICVNNADEIMLDERTIYIQEVTIDFDDHGYSESFYKAYEEQCFYALKVFFPDMEDEQIAELCTTLNELAFENIFPNEEGYSSDPVPCVLFYRDGIGCYPYFAVGEWRHICIIPVTEETIKAYADKGVEIYEME